MSGDHSEQEPPDPISNSEVKPLRADDSVGYAHVKVGHRQAPFLKHSIVLLGAFFLFKIDGICWPRSYDRGSEGPGF